MGAVQNKSPLNQTLASYTTYDGFTVNQIAASHGVFFVKWIPKSMKEKNIRYQEGGNNLNEPFVPYGDNKHGGIYFVDNTNAAGYAQPYSQYGLWRVRIPDTARVYTGQDARKLKANTLILDDIIELDDESIMKPIYKDCAAQGKLEKYEGLKIIRTRDLMEYALENYRPGSLLSQHPAMELSSWGLLDDPPLLTKAVSASGYSLKYIPINRCTYDLCYQGLQSGQVDVYLHMPDAYKTLEITDLAISLTGSVFKYTPLEHRNYARCEKAVSDFGQSLRDVPWEHRKNKKLVLLALQDEGYLIDETHDDNSYVVPEILRQDLDCRVAASWTYFGVWDRIPETYHTQERALYAVRSERSDICQWKAIPKSWQQSHELLTALVQHEPQSATPLIPKDCIDESLAELMFKHGSGLNVPARYWTAKQAWKKAIKGSSAQWIPSTLWTEEMVYHAIVSYHEALRDLQNPSQILTYQVLLKCIVLHPEVIVQLPSQHKLPSIESWFPHLLKEAGMIVGHERIRSHVLEALKKDTDTVGRYLPPPTLLDLT
jgi:hypothetical protein